MTSELQSINRQIENYLREEGLIEENILQKFIQACREQSLNLGQLLLQQRQISTQDFSKIMHHIRLVETNSKSTHADDRISNDSHSDLSTLPSSGSFGEYEIMEEIARGGMGVVYRAVQKGVGREVALKVILGEGSETAIKRFFREAQATAALDHPGIVPVYQMGKEQGYHFFTMKFIQGTTLKEYIYSDVPLKDKIQCFMKVCRALDYAHNNKVIHRDLKPANILLDDKMNPYITDFGLAKVIDSKSILTQTGSTIGTPYYMSPEQMRGNRKEITTKTDIYSLGIILYEILVQKLPFQSDTLSELYHCVAKTIPEEPKSAGLNISAALSDVCMQAIEKEAQHRYSSASEMADDLENALAGRQVSAKARSRQRRIQALFHSYRRWFIASTAIFLLALSYWFILFWQAEQRKQQETVIARERVAVEKICHQAHAAIIKNNWAEAETLLKMAIAKYPNHYQVYLEIGHLHKKRQAKDKAIQFFQKATRLAPNIPRVFIEKAQFHLHYQEFQQALQDVNHYLKISPDATGYEMQGEIYQRIGKKQQAQDSFLKANKLHRKELSPLLEKAKVSPAAQSLPMVNQVLQTFPGYEEALHLRAQIHLQEGRYSLALSDAEQLNQLKPSLNYLLLEVKCLEQTNQIEEAVEKLQPLLKQEHSQQEKQKWMVKLARLYSVQERYSEALRYYQEIFPEPTNAPKKYLLEMLKVVVALEMEEYIQNWSTILLQEKSPETLGVTHYQLSIFSLSQDDEQKTLFHLEKSIEYNFSLVNDARRDIGYLKFQQGKWAEAEKILYPLKNYFEEDPHYLWILGSSYFEMELWEKAITYLSQAIHLTPWKEDYYMKRAMAHKELENYTQAEKDLTIVNQLNPENISVILEIADILLGRNFVDNYAKIDFLEDVFESASRFEFRTTMDLFQEDIEKQGNRWLQAVKNINKRKHFLTTEQIDSLIAGLYSPNPALRGVAANQLRILYYDKSIRERVAQEKDKTSQDTVAEQIKTLYRFMIKRHQQDQKKLFRSLLFRYYYAGDTSALKAIYDAKNSGRVTLSAIVRNSSQSEFARFFAARALFDLCTPSSRHEAYKMIQVKDPETCLLLFVASTYHNPKRDYEKYFPAKINSSSDFLNYLYVRHTPKDHVQTLRKIIPRDEQTKLQLYALKRIRDLGRMTKSDRQKFIEFLQHPNPALRSFAITHYWNFSTKSQEKYRKQVAADKKYLMQATKDPHPLVRKAAIVKLADYDWNLSKKVLTKAIYDNDFGTRFVAIVLLAKRGEFDPLIPIMTSGEEPIFITAAVFSGGKKSFESLPPAELAKMYKKLYNPKSNIKFQDPRERIVRVAGLDRMEMKTKLPLLRPYFRSKDPYHRLGSILSSWKLKLLRERYQSEFERLINDEDLSVRQMAILAKTFTLSYQSAKPREQKFILKMEKASVEERIAASLGCRYVAFRNIAPLTTTKLNLRPLYWNWEFIYRNYLFGFYDAAVSSSKKKIRKITNWVVQGVNFYDQNPRQHIEKGILLLAGKQYKQAKNSFDRAKSLNSEIEDLSNIWTAYSYVLQQRSKPAVALLEKLAEKHPWDPEIANLYMRALSLGKGKKIKERYKKQKTRYEYLQQRKNITASK